MKTIVIIEKEESGLTAITDYFEQWPQEIKILTAEDEKTAFTIMGGQQIDLAIYDFSSITGTVIDNLSRFTYTFPCVPCIALYSEPSAVPIEMEKRGACHCFKKPVNIGELAQIAEEMLDVDTSGTVKGIPIHSLLQMLESEEKTCTLQVASQDNAGFLYVQSGQLISAETRNFNGEDAAQQILSWHEPVIRLRYFNGQRKRQIQKPLLSIIMEGFRLKHEKEKTHKITAATREHQLPLNHLATSGKRIPMEIGLRVKLEFPLSDTRFESNMVGMIPDRLLILTHPQPSDSMEDLVGFEQRVIVKFVQKGRSWMFKTQLLKVIEKPFNLLFFEYPVVLHYHELQAAKRSSIFLPCTFHLKNEQELFGTIVDLSTTGALCRIKQKTESTSPHLDLANAISLRCLMPGLQDEQRLSGIIRNLAKTNGELRVGVEFDNLQPHITEIIGNYLYALEEAAD
jgi:c-di-GMP-binding flagellar brake protein YcgR